MARGGQAGRAVERKVAAALRELGWIVLKGTTFGTCDLIALKAGERPRLIEVKSTSGGPWERFGPSERSALLEAAYLGGADAYLAWWPPRSELCLYHHSKWPGGPEGIVRDELAVAA
jgi:Holliday junction resolvase